jgi:hypothetical protein
MTGEASSHGVGGHTPGPWYVKPSTVSKNLCIYSGSVGDAIGGYGIGEAWDLNGKPQNAANAALIAAAPDLLEALREMLGMGELFIPTQLHSPGFKRARAAILRATTGGAG